jgi:hypothetical protein
MRALRFGRKIRLPSTVAIKHQLLTMMFQDEIRAIPPGGFFEESKSPALGMLRRLKGSPFRARVRIEGAAISSEQTREGGLTAVRAVRSQP